MVGFSGKNWDRGFSGVFVAHGWWMVPNGGTAIWWEFINFGFVCKGHRLRPYIESVLYYPIIIRIHSYICPSDVNLTHR